MPRTAFYAGSFDPVTNGHVDVVRHAARLADRLVLAIGVHPGKAPLFSADERLAMLEETCGPLVRSAQCELACVTFADLVVTAARRAGASLLQLYTGLVFRGLGLVGDIKSGLLDALAGGQTLADLTGTDSAAITAEIWPA